ncbi:hypothetical protein Btru_063273 [Bulinus truncatus]|nr:hypothetical protein Btru_063273 [Bulinus truncatus]
MFYRCVLLASACFILSGSYTGVSAATTADAPNDTTTMESTTAKPSKTTPRVVIPTFGSTPTNQTTTTAPTTTIKFPPLTTVKIVTLPAPPKYPSLPLGEKIFKYVRLSRKSLYGHLLVSWDIQDTYVTQEVNYTLITEYFRIGDCAVSKNLSNTKEEIPLQNMVRSYELQNVASWSSLAVTLRGTELARGRTDYITETVVTHETVPTGKPLNIHPMSIQPNSAQLAWSPPVCEERGGLLVKYDVELTSVNAPANVKPMTADSEYIALTSLTAFTYYQIRVRYVNSVGAGPYSDHFVFQTGQGPPSAPIVYNFTYDDISIGVVIVLPVQPNGQIDQYNIELTGGISHMTDLYTPLNGTEYIIGNLMPNTTYLIRARARNAAGWGDWSKQIQVSTKAEIKPSPIALRQIMANKTCIGFQWAPPSTDLNLVHSYEIRVFSNDQTSLPIRAYVSKDSLEHVQCGLIPYTHYSVSVSVMKDTGQTGHPLAARMWTEGMTPPKPRPPVIRKVSWTGHQVILMLYSSDTIV